MYYNIKERKGNISWVVKTLKIAVTAGASMTTWWAGAPLFTFWKVAL